MRSEKVGGTIGNLGAKQAYLVISIRELYILICDGSVGHCSYRNVLHT